MMSTREWRCIPSHKIAALWRDLSPHHPGVSLEQVLGPSRLPHIVAMRWEMIAALAKHHIPARIGDAMNRDRKTVCYAIAQMATAGAAAGVTDRLWSLDDVIAKIDELAPAPKVRGPYRKRGDEISN